MGDVNKTRGTAAQTSVGVGSQQISSECGRARTKVGVKIQPGRQKIIDDKSQTRTSG
jgi:hypothetical protein